MSDEKFLFKRNETWWLRTTVAGIQYRESLRTDDVKVARKRRDKRIEEITAARHFGERKVTWLAAVDAWGRFIVGQKQPKTLQRYAVSLKKVEPFLRTYHVADINGRVIADMIEMIQKTKVTAATIRRDLTAVSRVLEYAEARGWRDGNPTLSKRRILKERRDPIALPQVADIEAVIEHSPLRFGYLIRAAWLTGCRQDELVTARWRAFNALAGTLEVIGKGNKRRTIKLDPAVIKLIANIPPVVGSDLIFCGDNGDMVAQASSDFAHFRRKTVAKAGAAFQKFRFHDLRHLFAVEALRSGRMDIYTLSKHLGHSSVLTTEIYLAFLTPEEQEAAKKGMSQMTTQSPIVARF